MVRNGPLYPRIRRQLTVISRKVSMQSQNSERTRTLRVRLLQAVSVVALLGTAGVSHAGEAISPEAAEAISPEVSCASLTDFTMAHVQIISATHNAAGGGLPGYCNVVGVIDK